MRKAHKSFQRAEGSSSYEPKSEGSKKRPARMPERKKSPKKRYFGPNEEPFELAFRPEESKKRPADKLPEGEISPKKRYFASDKEYCEWLAESRETFQKYHRALQDEVDSYRISNRDEKAIYDRVMVKLDKIKEKVLYVLKYYESISSFREDSYIQQIIIDYLFSAYKENTQKNKDFIYNVNDLEQNMDKPIDQIQRVLVLFADFTLYKAKESQKNYRDVYNTLDPFVEQIKKSESGAQKSQRLRLYQRCLQRYEQELRNFRNTLEAMEETRKRGEDIHVSQLSEEFRNYRTNIRAIGSLIEEICPLSLLESLGTDKKTLYHAYYKTTDDLKSFEQKNQGLPKKQQMSNWLKIFSSMIDKAEAIHDYYSELAKHAISALAKGKGRAQPESSTDVSMEEFADTESDSEQIKFDRAMAEALQEKYNRRNSGSSQQDRGSRRHPSSSRSEAHSSDDLSSEGEIPDEEWENVESAPQRELSSDEVDQPQGDMLRKEEVNRPSETENRLYALHRKLLVMQMKLKMYLREPECLSDQEIQEVGRFLARHVTSIHQAYCSTLEQDEEAATFLEEKKMFYEENDLSKEQNHTKGNFKLVFQTIIDHQNYVLQKVKAILQDRAQEEHQKILYKRFVTQVEWKPEREALFQECNLDALKVEVRARDLGQKLLKEHGYIIWSVTTIAVAYMKNTEREIITAISINEKDRHVPETQDFIRKQKHSNERWIRAEKTAGRGRRHAERVLLDYAEENGLTIEALGSSRNFCSDCWRYIQDNQQIIISQALAQKKPDQLSERHARLLRNPQPDQPRTRLPRSLREPNVYSETELPVESSHRKDRKTHDGSEKQTLVRSFPEWVTDNDKKQLQETVLKGISDFLGIDYKTGKIDVQPILSGISIFKGPDGRLWGTNSYTALAQVLEEEYKIAQNIGFLRGIWHKSGKMTTKFTAIIPQGTDQIRWYWGSLCVLQKTGEKPIAYNSMLQFSKEEKTSQTEKQAIIDSYNHGEESQSAWKILNRLSKKSSNDDMHRHQPHTWLPRSLRKQNVHSETELPAESSHRKDRKTHDGSEKQTLVRSFPEWVTGNDKKQLQETVLKGISDFLGIDYKTGEIDVQPILSSISIFKGLDGKLWGTNSYTKLAQVLEEEYEIAQSAGSLHASWHQSGKMTTKFTAIIPQETDQIRWHWGALSVLQKTGEKPIAYNSMLQFSNEENISQTEKQAIIDSYDYDKEPQSVWKIIGRLSKKPSNDDIHIINVKTYEAVNTTYRDKIGEEGWYHFIRKDNGRVVERACVSKENLKAAIKFAEYIGMEDIISNKSVKASRRAFQSFLDKNVPVNGWTSDKSRTNVKKTGKRKKEEPAIIVWKYE